MTRVIPALLRRILILFLVGSTFASTALAQFRGGDRGGLLSQLRRSEVREALGLTPEQIAKVDELESRSRPERGALDPYFERLQNAESEEQRNVIREEMNAVTTKLRQEAEVSVRSVLTPEQLKKLVERLMADRGASALYDAAVRQELGLSDAQIADLDRLQAEREAAARELGRGSGPEQFQKFRQEWDSRFLSVLDESQKARWDSVANASDAEAGEAPAVATSNAASTSNPAAPASSPTTVAPPAETDSANPEGSAPVVSFGNPGESSPSDRTAGNEPLLTFNFRYAPWSDVLMLFADYANLTLDLNEVPPGTFNYYDRGKYTPTEALDVLNGYLLQKGYILVQRDNFLVCLNIDDGIPPNLVPNITADELPKRGLNELLNVVFPIQGVPATNAAKEVELLLGPQGKVVPLSTSNSLVVTDIGGNLRRIQRLLSSVSAGPGDQVFKLYPLKYLDPLDAETIVKSQLGITPGVRSVSSAYEDWRRDRDRDSRDSRSSSSSSSSSSSASSASAAKVSPDERTSSLLVTATAAQHRIVEDILKATDVPATSATSDRSRSGQPFLRVYSLQRSDAQEVVKTLDVLMPGVVVNEDGRSRKIHVHAPQAVQDEVERLIRQLDGEGSINGSAVTVISLTTLDPYAAAGTIRSLFAGDGDDAPVVEADSYGRRLMVRGTADQVAQVKTLLAELGEDGTGRAGSNYSTGPVRTIPLGGRDPEELLPLLQRLWETSGDAPLRVVPASPGMIIERRPLGRTNPSPVGAPATADSREAAERPAANFNVLDPVLTEEPVSTDVPAKAPEPAGENVEPEADSPPAATDGKEPVAVTVQGGSLVVVSENDQALNRFEDLVQKLGQVIPARTKWTVFYLRTADATETAMLLEQLFPSSSVSMTATDSSFMGAFTGGLSSFGSSLMDATGLDSMGLDTQTLRIIPDIRSNSLFVTGPPDKVAEIEQVLDVLDATDLPDSLRDRLPRMIDVRYADVEQVAEIVREVYKDYLQPANAAAMAGNPLAMLMGGGGGGRSDRDRRDQPQGAIRLTVGVDTATSKLIVSADEALFRQIEDLVRSLDDAQLQAKRTVSVVSLENADATLVQSTLGSLIPKVRTSSTADRRTQSSNSNGSSNGSSTSNGSQPQQSSGPSQEDQERLRRLMEMRARFGGGDSGRSSFGFGGGDRGGDRGNDRGDRGSRSSGRGR